MRHAVRELTKHESRHEQHQKRQTLNRHAHDGSVSPSKHGCNGRARDARLLLQPCLSFHQRVWSALQSLGEASARDDQLQ